MPSLNDLLKTKRTAVAALEDKQRSRQLKLDDLAAARRLVETTWFAVTSGVALGHAAGDSSFHATLAAILDERLTAKRDRKLFDEWKAGSPETLGQAAEAAPGLPKARKVRPRIQAPDIDLENVSAAELLQNVDELEADALLAQKEEAAAQDDVKEATKALRKRDSHWRIKVGEVVLEHAKRNDDFHQRLNRIFEQRVAKQHRPLLDRWRNATVPDAAPPPATTPTAGWRPKKLPANRGEPSSRKPPARPCPTSSSAPPSSSGHTAATSGSPGSWRSSATTTRWSLSAPRDAGTRSRPAKLPPVMRTAPRRRPLGEDRGSTGTKQYACRAVAGHEYDCLNQAVTQSWRAFDRAARMPVRVTPAARDPVLRRPRRVPGFAVARAHGRTQPLAA